MRQCIVAAFLLFVILCGCASENKKSVAFEDKQDFKPEESLTEPQEPPSMPADNIADEQQDKPSTPEMPPLKKLDIDYTKALELIVTKEDGIISISTPEELYAFAVLVNSEDESAVNAHVVLEEDINLINIDFIPIGYNTAFLGDFDGAGHIITGLTILEKSDAIGMFGTVGQGGVIHNLHIIGGQLGGENIVGGIAGNNSGIIKGCSFRGTVESAGIGGGGICGVLQGKHNAGKQPDDTAAGKILQCASNAQVSGFSNVGGLVGKAESGAVVSDCYALGSVTSIKGNGSESPHNIGGLAGEVSGDITRCYASIEVFTSVNSKIVGGFAGLIDSGAVSNCYLNSKPVENWKPVGYSIDDALYDIMECTVEEITEKSTFSGWDFEQIWDIAEDKNRGLPFLQTVVGG